MTLRDRAYTALRYALALLCIGLAVLLHLSPVGTVFHPMGLFILGVVAAAWFGGPGPGVFAAFLAAIALPHLIAIAYPLSLAYPLLAGIFDLPRFITLALTGGAVGWGTSSYRRVRDELETAVRERTAHLAASEERYVRATQASEDGIWEWNAATDEFFMSDQARHLWAVPEGVAVRTRAELKRHGGFHPEDFQRAEGVIAEDGKLGAHGFDMEYRVIGLGGEVRWVRSQGKAFPGAGGRPTLVTGSLTDITERKRAEEALRESEERYQRVMLAADSGIWDWDVAKDKYYVSPRFLELCGIPAGTTFCSREEFIRHRPIHPEDREKWEQAVRALFASRDARVTMEVRSIVNGEARWRRLEGICFRDAAGRVVRWTGTSTDITDRKDAEEALRRSEERYALAVAGSDDGVWDVDFAARRVFVSARARELAGLPSGPELVPMEEYFAGLPLHPDDVPRRVAALQAHMTGKAPAYEGEFRVRQPDGVYRWRRIHGLCVRDANGEPYRMAGSISDIDARRGVEDALRLSEGRYALAMEAAGDGHTDWNLQTSEHYISPRLLQICGYAPGSTFGNRAEWVRRFPFHPEDRPKWERAVAAHFAGRESHFKMELRIVVHGEVRWTAFHFLSTRNAAGTPIRWTGSIGDITEQKRVEEALRASEERSSLAMEASEEGYVDANVDTDEFVTSERLNQIFGISAGTRFANRSQFLKHFRFYGDDAEIYRAAVGAVVAKDGPDRYEFEFRIVRPSGEVRWLWTRGKVTRDAEGRARRRVGVVADITARKLAEEARRLSEERYSLAMQVAEEGHLDWNVQTGEFFASAQAKRVMDVPQDAEHRTRHDVMGRVQYHPEDAPRVSAAWRASLAGREVEHELDYRILRGAEPRWIRGRWRIFRDTAGEAQRVIGVVSDITERKQAVDTLRESERRFRRMTELSADTYWEQDERLRYTRTGSDRDIAGYAIDVNQGKTRWELCGDATPLSGSWLEHQAVLAAQQPFRDFEYRRRQPDGSIGYYSASGAPMFDDEGRFRGYQGVARNITAFKRIEQDLRQSEGRFRALTELSSDWYWQQDENLRFTYMSAQAPALGGYTEASSIGKTRWALEGLLPLSCTWAEHEAVLGARQVFRDLELRRVMPDGSMCYLSISGAPIFDDEGRFQGYHGVGRDITERRQAVETLRESESRFRTLVELNSGGFWEQDHNLRYTPSVFRHDITGYSTDDRVGKTRWELCGDLTPLSSTWQEHQAVLTARLPFRDFEYRRLRPDGTIGYFSASGAPIFDEKGRFSGYYGVASDITVRKRIEEDLRQSEVRFRALTELSSDWYWRQDADLRFTYVSQQVADGDMYPPEWVVGKTRWELPGITPLSFTWAEHQAVLAARQPFRDVEYGRVGRDGRIEYVSVSGAPIFDERGSFKGYQGTGRNITERKRIEEELRARQEMLDLAQKSARITAFEWKVGAGEAENRWSPDLEAMYGLRPGTYDGTLETWKKLVHPEDRPAVEEAISNAQRTGDVASEYRVVHADGSVHWVQAQGRMFFDAAGDPARMVGFMQDITERKRVEEALRQSEERYALAVAGSNEGIFDWDLVSDRVYVSYRAQELFGLPRSDLWRPRRDWRHVLTFHPDDAPRLHDSIKANIEGGTPTYDEEFRIVVHGGEVRWFRQRGIALRDASGKAYRVVGSIGDVTEKHKVEEELKAVERKLRLAQRLEGMGTLAGGIAHDFNNILGAILGYGEMAMRDAKKGSRLRRDLDSIMAAGERGRALVDRILAFSRSGVAERVPVDVDAVVREALDQIAANLPENVTIAPCLRTGRAAMLGDSTQVHQVVMNLATNAVQAMPHGGVLRVALDTVHIEAPRAALIGTVSAGEHIVLKISDAGIGIRPEVLERMFDPFFTTKEVGVGSGLGLSLVHGIVATVGGAIDVATELGKGSSFTVYLPRRGYAPEKVANEDRPLPRGDGERVLVVDDEESLVRLATETLESLGYAPVGFTSSANALKEFGANPRRFDAILTDERMPGVTGSAIIREVRRINPSIPILLMSGFVGGAAALKARELGATDVLKKPLLARELATSLARALQVEV